MKTMLPVSLLALMPLVALAQTPAPDAAPPPPSVMPVVAPMSADECAVWEREKSFAASSAAHDSAAFAEHVQVGAVFINGNQAPTRGREGVLKDWAPIIEGKTIRLNWYPGFVAIGGDAHVAVSRGPYWIEDPSPEAKSRWRVGDFESTWVKDPDGQWRVLVDGGGPPSRPATEEEVNKLKAGLPARCPRL